jgi:hypothetical protein
MWSSTKDLLMQSVLKNKNLSKSLSARSHLMVLDWLLLAARDARCGVNGNIPGVKKILTEKEQSKISIIDISAI